MNTRNISNKYAWIETMFRLATPYSKHTDFKLLIFKSTLKRQSTSYISNRKQ